MPCAIEALPETAVEKSVLCSRVGGGAGLTAVPGRQVGQT